MAEKRSKPLEVELEAEPPKLKKSVLVCSLKGCSAIIKEDRVEVVVSYYSSSLIEWSSNGDGVFHPSCWAEVLRNTRVRNPKKATMKIESEERQLLKEAAKTAEYHESNYSVQSKAKTIAKLITQSRHCIAFTGAGISTSAGIGDYRGKRGKWTEQDRGQEEEEEYDGIPYEQLRPTYTHESLAKLVEMGLVKHVISQNGDGLHCLSGIPSDKLSELHGNVFEELCEDCGHRYIRSYYVLDDDCSQYYEDLNDLGRSDIIKPPHAVKCTQCGLSHRTGRKCDMCSGHLKDSIINFGDDLQEEVLLTAKKEAQQNDLLLSLGTTMTVYPASDLIIMGKTPLQLVIVNRQKTDYDYLCDGESVSNGVRVFGDCDDVMRLVMMELMDMDMWRLWEKERADRLKIYNAQRLTKRVSILCKIDAMTEDQELDQQHQLKTRKWYHVDVKGTPCARDSLIYGIFGGGVSGMLYYMKSGVVKRSCDIAVGGFIIISFISWEVCRYQRAKIRAKLKKTVDTLNSINKNNVNKA